MSTLWCLTIEKIVPLAVVYLSLVSPKVLEGKWKVSLILLIRKGRTLD